MVALALLWSLTTLAQDALKLKDNRKTFTGQMIRIDWSSFKFQLPDGGIIQQVTEQIDSVYLSDATMRSEAMKIEVLKPRITALPVKQISLPVMTANQQTELRVKQMSYGIQESGRRLTLAGVCLLAFLGCEAAAFTVPNNGSETIPIGFAAAGLGFFITSGIELILAGNSLKKVQLMQNP